MLQAAASAANQQRYSPSGCILYAASLLLLLTAFDACHLLETYATTRIGQFYGDYSHNFMINIAIQTKAARLNLALRVRTS